MGYLPVVSQKHFQIEVGYDDQGPTVTVTHPKTGLQRCGRPREGESIGKVQMRLVSDLSRQICNPEEFTFEIGRCGINGKTGTFYRVTHCPSGKTKELDSISCPRAKRSGSVWEKLMDALVEELWHKGIRPKMSE